MSDAELFNTHWYRIRGLRPRLANDVHVVRQVFRGVSSHLLHRRSTSAYHRLDSIAFDLVARFDGERTVEEVWLATLATHNEQAPTQSDCLELLSDLHNADLIVTDREIDAERLFDRMSHHRRHAIKGRLGNPLYLRFALCDPDNWITALECWLRPLFSHTARWAWSALIAIAAIQLLPRLDALIVDISTIDFTAPHRILQLLTMYVLMKLVHELAHALTVKHHGGDVHEFGIALMVLLPLPYTDASASTLFDDKYQRMQVSAAGIVVDLAMAAMGGLLWSSCHGTCQDIGLMLLVIGGVSSIVFNANPLLKFDGYHMLADWLEIPNLAERARRYALGHLGQRLLGLPDRSAVEAGMSERCWLWLYWLLSSLYRVTLMLSIAWMLSQKYFVLGLVLSLWILASLCVLPIARLMSRLRELPPGERRRSSIATVVIAATLGTLLSFVPVTGSLLADAVVWMPEDTIVRAGTDCQVTRVHTVPSSTVQSDQPLLHCEDPTLELQQARAKARIRELEAEAVGLAVSDPSAHEIARKEIRHAHRKLALINARFDAQHVKSRSIGQFVIEHQQALIGRHFHEGAIIGFIVPPERRTLRVALSEAQSSSIDLETSRIDVALTQHPSLTGSLGTDILRTFPRPDHQIISAALTQLGGGSIAARRENGQIVANETIVDLELAWPLGASPALPGGRAQVRFERQAEPLAYRWWRELHHALLKRTDA